MLGNANLPHPGMDASLGEPASGFDLLKTVLRHKSLFFLGIVVAYVLGALYYVRQTPIYESRAEVLIVNKHPDAAGGGLQSYFADYMSTHEALVASPAIVNRAVAQGDIGQLRAAEILGGLRVSSGSAKRGGNNILTLSYRGKVPEECAAVVNAVLKSYQEFLEETYSSMTTDTLRLMSEARDELLSDLKDQEEQYRQFRATSPLLIVGEEAHNPVQARMGMIQSQQSELLLKRTELESQLAAIEKAKREGRDDRFISNLVSNMVASSQVHSEAAVLAQSEKLQTALLPLLQQEEELLQHYGAKHPTLAAVRLRIKHTRDVFEHPERHAVKSNTSGQYVEYLKQEIDRLATLEGLLAKLYESEYQAAKELTSYELRDQEFNRNMGRTQQLYDGIITRLQETNLTTDMGGFKADVIAPPQFGTKVQPQAGTVFLASTFLGILLGAGVAFVAELSDSSFRSPEEAATTLRLPVVGLIPQFAPPSIAEGRALAKLDRSLATYFWPRSAQSEAYRGLRTGLYFKNRGQTHKVIQVTSPCPGDGKSTIASNLSICIAQSGKQVLLIDADMRKPRQHAIFGAEAEAGMSTLLAMDEELNDVVQPTSIENLWLLPAGQLPPDPAELLTSQRFAELVQLVRERYDYVIIDSGPLLVISDPSIISSQVDGVVLAMRLKKTKRRQAERAMEILRALEAPIIGVVANAAGNSEARMYGYGSYGDYHHSSSGERSAKPRALTVGTTS